MVFRRSELGLNLESLRCVFSDSRLTCKDHLCIFRNRKKCREIYSAVASTLGARKVSFGYRLAASRRAFIRCNNGGFFHRCSCFRSRCIAFGVLIDRATGLCRADHPFRAIAIKAFFRKRVATAGSLEFEPVRKLSSSVYLNIRQRYRVESLCDRKDRISSRQDPGYEAAVIRRAHLLKYS